MTKPSLVENGAAWSLTTDLNVWTASLSVAAATAIEQALESGARHEGTSLFVPAVDLSLWPESVAIELGLPANCPLGLDIRLQGAVGREGARLSVRWLQPGKTIPARDANLEGCWLQWSGKPHRLQAPLEQIIREVDAFNRVIPTDLDSQFRAWAAIRECLGESADQLTDGFLRSLRVVTASAFTWRIHKDKQGDLQLAPALLTERLTEDGQNLEHVAALTAADEEIFAKRLDDLREGASAFPVTQGLYVVAEPRLQAALTAVRQLRRAPVEQRKRAALHPESVIREILKEPEDAPSAFVETESFADRVIDVAEWVAPVLPWVKIQPQSWAPPTQFGIRIQGVDVPLAADQLDAACTAMANAIAAKLPAVEIGGVQVPASQANLDALACLKNKVQAKAEGPTATDPTDREDKPSSPKVLVIETNFEEVAFSRSSEQQRCGNLAWPNMVRTPPKNHQKVGLEWLQRHWIAGSSGAMLCDDMGLGKTFQALAFCAWLRELMQSGAMPRQPLLLVAPVGLLRNWEKEHDEHLHAPGLGDIVKVYGEHVKQIKRGSHSQGTASLDTACLSQADVVLANYESISSYQLSFGAVPFAAVILDEAQKIKSPGTRVTSAVKGLNATFFVAMTGTPVENRLSDLWCIADAVQPSALGDLKNFSSKYETEGADVKSLRDQVWQEEAQSSGHPKLILRRLKSEKLDGLPKKIEHPMPRPMPPRQLDAYMRAVQQQGMQGEGAMLELIHNLRRASLHPVLVDGGLSRGEVLDPNDSARMQVMLEILDEVSAKDEKALIFLESLDLQDAAQIPTLLQRRYGLKRLPMIINGEVGTTQRQERVDLFQDEKGFDVMLLSPKAGGVGLTLTAANHVIHLSRWWNPAVEDQCSDRVYRIGQKKDVHVYYPMAVLPEAAEHSFDVQLQRLMERKRELARNLLAPPVFTKQDYAEMRAAMQFGPDAERAERDRTGPGAVSAIAKLFEALGEQQTRGLLRTILEDKEIKAVGVPPHFDFNKGDLKALIRPDDVPWLRVRLVKPIEGGWEVDFDEGVPLAFRRCRLHCRVDASAPHGWVIENIGPYIIG